MKIRRKMSIIILFLMICILNVFGNVNKSKNYYVVPNALLCITPEKYKYWFNFLAARNFSVNAELYDQIKSSGGTRFTKGYRPAKIVEVYSGNNKIVRIDYQIDYSNERTSKWWTHIASLILVEEYNKRFL